MKTTKTITLALGVLTAVASSYAQTTTTSRTTTTSESGGLLGHKYSEFGFGIDDVKHISDHAYSLRAGGNVPIVPGQLDAGGSYSYSWMGGDYRGHANTIAGYLRAYAPMERVKPFLGAGLAYQWLNGGWGSSEDHALWNLSAGLEIPAGAVTVTPKATYHDDFRNSRDSRQDWTLAVDVNYWMNPTTALYVSGGKHYVRHSRFDSRKAEIGMRSRF